MSEQRLAEAAEWSHKTYSNVLKEITAMRVAHWTSLNHIHNALAYCDRILANNPNGAELMFLVTVKKILQGMDDGLTANETEDKTNGR